MCKEIKERAVNALIEMGLPANIKGFKFIVSAMELFADETYDSTKTIDLYKKIAEIYGDKYTRVERAIRHAFAVLIQKGDYDAVNKYLTFQNTKNSNLLAVLYLRILQEGD